MSDLLQEHITKPKADDMSMDEILASIRRIISTSSTSEMANKAPEPEYKYNNSVETKQAPKREQALSAREQLLALTKPNLYDSDFTPDNRFSKPIQKPTSGQPQQTQQAPKTVESVYQKPFYDTLSKDSKTQEPVEALHKEDDNHDAEILQALNEIRETLGHTIQSNLPPKETIQNTNKTINRETTDNTVQSQINAPIIPLKETNTIHSKENIFDEINLRSPQITGDAVPEFLKNFKRQQELDKQKAQKKPNAPEYDFSKLANFNDPEDVLTLTEKIMPMSQEELKQQENLEKTAKRNLSKLREGTEEIMKRATERHFDNSDDDDVVAEDTNMTNVIMRTLQPMLKEWIDENMHKIAEQVLRQEFRRGLK